MRSALTRFCRDCGGNLGATHGDPSGCSCEREECETWCVYGSRDHEGPCVDEPPHLYDPRPEPREHPEFWKE